VTCCAGQVLDYVDMPGYFGQVMQYLLWKILQPGNIIDFKFVPGTGKTTMPKSWSSWYRSYTALTGLHRVSQYWYKGNQATIWPAWHACIGGHHVRHSNCVPWPWQNALFKLWPCPCLCSGS